MPSMFSVSFEKIYSLLHKRKAYHSEIKTNIVNDKLWRENRKRKKKKLATEILGLVVFQNLRILLIYGFWDIGKQTGQGRWQQELGLKYH